MPITQNSPGVIIREESRTNAVVTGSNGVGAFAGAFPKGPVDEIVTIGTERQLVEVFGEPNDDNYEYWFSAANFLLYGGSIKIVRSSNLNLKNSIDSISYFEPIYDSTDVTLTVVDSTNISVNDFLQINNEFLTVTSIGTGGNLLVARGQLDSTAVNHPSGSLVNLFGVDDVLNQTTIATGTSLAIDGDMVTVDSALDLNSGIDSYILINNEILKVTAIVGDVLTVERAQFNTVTSGHLENSTVRSLNIINDLTSIEETTEIDIPIPLIKNSDDYETNVEYAANRWKWGARYPGTYGNGIRVVVTDAGPDQILYLQSPSINEWIFNTNDDLDISSFGIYSKVYKYSLILTLDNSSIIGNFVADEEFSNGDDNVFGTILAYDNRLGRLEVSIDSTSTSYLTNGTEINSTQNNGSAVINSIERRLVVANSINSNNFARNQTVQDSNGNNIIITNVGNEYDSRIYGYNQRWSSIANRPGTSEYVRERGGHKDLMHILVFDGNGDANGAPGALLERFLNVSKAKGAKSTQGNDIYYKDVIKRSSNYIWCGSHENENIFDVDTSSNGSIGNSTNTIFDIFRSNESIYSSDNPNRDNSSVPLINTKYTATIKYNLKGGTDGYSIERERLFGSYDLFNDPETEEVDFIIMGPGLPDDTDTLAKAQKVIDISNIRKDSMSFVSPPRNIVVSTDSIDSIVVRTIEFFNQISSTSYAVFDNNYKYIYDKYNDLYRWIPCNSDTAGSTLRTGIVAQPWYSPAGFTRGQLLNVTKLAYSPLKRHRDLLYSARCNFIVSFPGRGIVLFGDRTALSDFSNYLSGIGPRRSFLVMERAIGDTAKNILFDINDEYVRSNFLSIVNPYLQGIKSNRGISDFYVVCNAENNPDDSVSRGELYAEFYIKPNPSVNFIELQFSRTQTSASFAEVVS